MAPGLTTEDPWRRVTDLERQVHVFCSMKDLRQTMFWCALLGTALVTGLALILNREPSYKGHGLTYWLASSVSLDWQRDGSHNRTEVPRAVKTIGTNAIPILLKWLETKRESQTEIHLVFYVKRLIPSYRHLWRFDKLGMAEKGFEILGTNAVSAIPTLVRCASDADYERRWAAIVCLELVGAQKEIFVPVLGRSLKDPQEVIRVHAVRVLHSRFPQEAEAAGVYGSYPSLLAPVTNTTTFE